MAKSISITSSCTIENGKIFEGDKLLFAGEQTGATQFFVEAYRQLGFDYPKFYKMDNLCKLGWLAAEVLLNGSLDKQQYAPEKIGLVLANTNSSLDADLKYWQSVQDIASPSLFVYTLPNIVIGEICIRHGFKGEGDFFIMPKPDIPFLKQQATYFLNSDILNSCIYGWVDILADNYKAELYVMEISE